jgi:cytochrome P450
MYSGQAPLYKLTCYSLAYAEMRLLLAKLLWHFDFELEVSEEDWYGILRAFMVWEREPLRNRLRPVER